MSRRLVAASRCKTHLQNRASQFRICSRHSGIGTRFFQRTSVSPAGAIPPMLHTHHHLNTLLIRRTSGRSLGSYKQSDANSGTGQPTVFTLFRPTPPPYTATYSKSSLAPKVGQQTFPQLSITPVTSSQQYKP
jgi:hypothetical protein